MAKKSFGYHCTNCDYRPPKWLGCCPACGEWNSIIELQKNNQQIHRQGIVGANSLPQLHLLSDVTVTPQARMQTGIEEWDRVMGGGIVPGSFIIVTGDPGIGKSTLLLRVAHSLAANKKIIYFSSEESLQQVKERATRLNCTEHPILFSDAIYLEIITENCHTEQPDIIIVDSVQNCYSQDTQLIPGTVAQLREAAFKLLRIAKEKNIAIIATGHITKEGTIAGPRLLEHMVDAVFYLQGDERWQSRVLRSVKNRFGSTSEIGFFCMGQDGLQPLKNINQELVSQISHAPGSALVSSLEGSRPLLLELQALVVASKLAMPQRIVSGIDQKQVALIAAILEKYLRIKFSTYDLFFKVSGGFKTKESGTDLGIAFALISSYLHKPLPQKSIALAEISLTGTIQPITNISAHLHEAKQFGFEHIFISSKQTIESAYKKLPIITIANVYDLLKFFPE